LCYRSLPDLAAHCAHVEQLPDDPLGYAADLYAALHRLDDAGVEVILAVRPPDARAEDADWLAITDRLQRAAAKV
jgi:L-threonylcarbamoyladenylate synthase